MIGLLIINNTIIIVIYSILESNIKIMARNIMVLSSNDVFPTKNVLEYSRMKIFFSFSRCDDAVN